MNKILLIRLMRVAVALAVLCACNAVVAAEAESIAMVTDLTGKAVMLEKSGKRAVSILSEIKADSKIQLDDRSSVVILYLKSKQEYEIIGPARVQFAPDQPQKISGNQPKKRNALFVAGGSDIRIAAATVVQAATTMRGAEPSVSLLNLKETLTLETQPEFRWKSRQPNLQCQFILKNEQGEILLETILQGHSYQLPGTIHLDDQQTYSWEVSLLPVGGANGFAAGEFGIASAALRKTVEMIRPRNTAPLSARVAFATWLDQMNLKDEARKYWQAAAAERPEDPQLAARVAN